MEVKIFKISGSYKKKHQYFNFTKYARALKQEDALEKVFTIVTGDRILRRKIKILEISEVDAESCPDLYMKALSEI
jgi:ribosomal protein L20A (L18A)